MIPLVVTKECRKRGPGSSFHLGRAIKIAYKSHIHDFSHRPRVPVGQVKAGLIVFGKSGKAVDTTILRHSDFRPEWVQRRPPGGQDHQRSATLPRRGTEDSPRLRQKKPGLLLAQHNVVGHNRFAILVPTSEGAQ